MNIIDDKIHIPITDQVREQLRGVARQLIYKNPEYYKKMNMGFSVYGVPKEIRTYEIKNNTLEIMRGELHKVTEAFPDMDFSFNETHYPIRLVYRNDDFALDEYQLAAVDAIVKNTQGIVHAVTSAGKTLIILKAITELKQKALIVVHRKILMQQFLEDIEKYIRDENGNPITPGIIGDGKVTVGDITIAIDKTLGRHQELWNTFGAVFMDECHICPAKTLFSIMNNLPARRRFGFSGTLKRQDQQEFLIYSTFGRVIATIDKEQLLEEKRVVPVETKIITTECKFDWDEAVELLGVTKAHKALDDHIAHDTAREAQIISLVSKLPGKTIVLSRFVAPCNSMAQKYFEATGKEPGIITGKNSKKAIASYEAMKHGDLSVIFATIGCVSTGVSISDLDNIVLVSPVYNNELLLHQIRGRLMRTFEGKEKGNLYFLWDHHIFPEWKVNKLLRILDK